MSIKSLLGGEVNYKYINKHYQKEYKKLVEKQKFDNEMDEIYFNRSRRVDPENFIKVTLEITTKDYKTREKLLKDFLKYHPNAIAPEYNSYYVRQEVTEEKIVI